MSKYSLIGVDGNAFGIMGYVQRCMRETGFTKEEFDEYFKKATSSNYPNLMRVSVEMIDKCNERIK